MNGFLNFIADSKVHDSLLGTMIVTSFLAAVRRFKTIDNTPIAPGFWAALKLLWNFIYDWLTGFWSMKTGHSVTPSDPNSKVPDKADPTPPEAPAQPNK